MASATVDFSEADLPKPLGLIYNYWNSKRGDRLMPSRTDINPVDMRDFLSHAMLIDVLTDAQGEKRFRMRLVGTHIVSGYGGEFTGKYLDEIDLGDQRDKVIQACLLNVNGKKPVYLSGKLHHKTSDGVSKLLTYERLGLPLSSDGETVNILLIGALVHTEPN